MSGGHFGYIIHDGTSHWAKNVSDLRPGYQLEDHELPSPVLITGISFEPKLVHQLAIWASVLGPDGIGLYDGENHLQRSDFTFPSLPEHIASHDQMLEEPAPGMFLIGHTFRDEDFNGPPPVISQQVHPILYGGIYMAANGRVKNFLDLWYHHLMESSMGLLPPTRDADVLIRLLHQFRDPEHVLGLCDMDNSWSVVYFDSNSGELHICVKDSPFFISEQEGTLYWCTREFPESAAFEGHMILKPFTGFAVLEKSD